MHDWLPFPFQSSPQRTREPTATEAQLNCSLFSAPLRIYTNTSEETAFTCIPHQEILQNHRQWVKPASSRKTYNKRNQEGDHGGDIYWYNTKRFPTNNTFLTTCPSFLWITGSEKSNTRVWILTEGYIF